jgi:hypothetical protein
MKKNKNKKKSHKKHKSAGDNPTTISNAKILSAKSTGTKLVQINVEKVNLKKAIDDARASCDNAIASAQNALNHALDSGLKKYNDLIARKDGEIAMKIAKLKEELINFKSSNKKVYDNFVVSEKAKCTKIISDNELLFAKKKADAERLYSNSVMTINKKYN